MKIKGFMLKKGSTVQLESFVPEKGAITVRGGGLIITIEEKMLAEYGFVYVPVTLEVLE